MKLCSANSHMFVPLQGRTSLHTCIYSQVYTYTYIFICIYFILQILLCVTPCCANQHMSVPLRVFTLRTSLHTYICHKYTYITSQIPLYTNPCCAISHLHVPLRVLTVRTSLYTCIYSQVYIYHIKETFMCVPLLCELKYACALASARTYNLFAYIHMLTSIHIWYYRFWTFVYNSVLCELTYVCALASAHT